MHVRIRNFIPFTFCFERETRIASVDGELNCLKVRNMELGERKGQETKFCSNCKRDIPASNFMLHEPHCRRHVELCKVCTKPVPKSKMDEHMQAEHVEIPCMPDAIIAQNMMMENLRQVTAHGNLLPPPEILPLQPPRLRVTTQLIRKDATLANALQHELNQLTPSHMQSFSIVAPFQDTPGAAMTRGEGRQSFVTGYNRSSGEEISYGQMSSEHVELASQFENCHITSGSSKCGLSSSPQPDDDADDW